MNNHLWFDAIGWVGAAALLVAYAMISSRKWEGHSSAVQFLNIGGRLLLAANTIFYGSYPSTFVNLISAAIAIFTIATRKRVSSRQYNRHSCGILTNAKDQFERCSRGGTKIAERKVW